MKEQSCNFAFKNIENEKNVKYKRCVMKFLSLHLQKRFFVLS